MKILITGGSGFIGSAVVRRALLLGHSVINVDCLTYAASPKTNIKLEGNSNYIFENINICHKNKILKTIKDHKPNAIIHLAAESHVDRSIHSSKVFMETNILGTYNLLEASRDYLNSNKKINNFRFLHVSTDEVYGSLGKSGFFREESKYSPNSPYSASKASSDHLVNSWFKTYGLPTIITNCSNNYGPYQFPEKLIPSTILNCIRGENIEIYGDGKNIRDWLFVDDHADVLLQIIEKSNVGEQYNIGGNNEITNNHLVQLICENLDKKISSSTSFKDQIKYVDDRPGHDFRYAVDTSKVTEKIGWTPNVSFRKGLDLTITWYLNNQDWWKLLSR